MITAAIEFLKQILFSKLFGYAILAAGGIFACYLAVAAYNSSIATAAREAERAVWEPKFNDLAATARQVTAQVAAAEKARLAKKTEKESELKNASKQLDLDSQAASRRRAAAATDLAGNRLRLYIPSPATDNGSVSHSNAATSSERETAAPSARVLTRLLAVSDRLAEIYAGAADDARERGLSCERHYDAAALKLSQ